MIVKALIIYLAIVVYFVLDAIAAQIYEDKGYKQIKGALWGLIPVYGIIRALKVPPLKAVTKAAIRRPLKSRARLFRITSSKSFLMQQIICIIYTPP